MAGNIWRLVAVGGLALALTALASGCSLVNPGSTAPPAPASSAAGGPVQITTTVGEEIYHVFQTGDKQADFSTVPATGLTTIYLNGTGQVGQLDTSSTDPTIRSLNIVFNNTAANATAHTGTNPTAVTGGGSKSKTGTGGTAAPATPADVVTVTLYNYEGTVIGTVPVTASGSIDISTYNAVSVSFTATAGGAAVPSPAPYAYLYQMTNSAGNIFTYTVPVPGS